MDHSYRNGPAAAPANVYTGASAAEKPRENRIVENQLHSANRMIDAATSMLMAMDDLRARLLGISEPNAPPRDREEPKLVRAELPELSVLLERLEVQLGAMGSKIGDLQRI